MSRPDANGPMPAGPAPSDPVTGPGDPGTLPARVAGNSVLARLSPLAFGGAPIGGLYASVSDDDAVAAVRCALEAGLTYIDTAPHYGLGESERRIGMALRGVPRDSYVLSTKVGRLLVPLESSDCIDGQGFDTDRRLRREWDFSRDGILRSVEQSLARLEVDRIDVLYLHDPDDHEQDVYDSGFPALAELRAEGVVAAIGAGMNQSEMLTRFIRRLDLDLVLLAGRYTLLDQGAAGELFPACLDAGVGVVVGGALNSGLLADPSSGAKFDYVDAPAELVQRALAMNARCAAHGVGLVSAALQFPLAHPAVRSVLVGARSAAEVATNREAFDRPVPGAVWSELRAAGLLPTELPVPA